MMFGVDEVHDARSDLQVFAALRKALGDDAGERRVHVGQFDVVVDLMQLRACVREHLRVGLQRGARFVDLGLGDAVRRLKLGQALQLRIGQCALRFSATHVGLDFLATQTQGFIIELGDTFAGLEARADFGDVFEPAGFGTGDLRIVAADHAARHPARRRQSRRCGLADFDDEPGGACSSARLVADAASRIKAITTALSARMFTCLIVEMCFIRQFLLLLVIPAGNAGIQAPWMAVVEMSRPCSLDPVNPLLRIPSLPE